MMTRTNRRILLVGWDAADWKVIRPQLDHGRMPHLARLIAEGVSGNLATLYPPLSPMLWTSIATGKRPPKHGVLGVCRAATQMARVCARCRHSAGRPKHPGTF